MNGDPDFSPPALPKNFMQIKQSPYKEKKGILPDGYVHGDSCPNCGYCPHCGRSNSGGLSNQWPYRVPDYTPYWLWNAKSAGTTCNSADAQNSVGQAPASLGQTPIAFVTGLSPANSH